MRVQPLFWHNGSTGTAPDIRLARTYDTWTTSYESDGFPQKNRGRWRLGDEGEGTIRIHRDLHRNGDTLLFLGL